MTPEQIHALRPVFERSLKARNISLDLKSDGFSYAAMEVNDMWEGFLIAAEHFQDTVKLLAMYGEGVKTSEYMENLRTIRGYSKCFTGAFDKKEPVFVLRAQDQFAVPALAQWLMQVKDVLGESHPKFIAAKATLGTFIAWETKKVPD